MAVAGAADRPQLFELALERQAVAALDLGGGGAVAKHAVEAPDGIAGELILASGSRRSDRGQDAAAGGSDLEIGLAGQPHREFVLAASRPRQVGVRVDESRHQGAAAAVEALDLFGTAKPPASLLAAADEGDDKSGMPADGSGGNRIGGTARPEQDRRPPGREADTGHLSPPAAHRRPD